MIRFLHTADWQLGMTRHFFSDGVQEKYSQVGSTQFGDSVRSLRSRSANSFLSAEIPLSRIRWTDEPLRVRARRLRMSQRQSTYSLGTMIR